MSKSHILTRIIAVLVLILATAVPARGAGDVYSYNCTDKPIETVLKDLRKVTGYDFVYQKEVLKGVGHINCRFNNMTISQIMNRLFADEDVEYQIVDKTIILSKAEKEPSYYKSTVSGTITDESNEPLAGATVMLVGTTQGVSADIDGQFSIILEKGFNTLRVSYVGMQTVTMKVKPNEKILNIVMHPSEDILNEIVVTGYQNLKRESATGSYQTITAADLDTRYSSTVTDNLEGKVPGLLSYDNGNGKSMTIRGTGSFNASTSPLVVVDGLPIEGSIETVNPYDIENITVLKDAAAAAIYGARASNGVIVITTKKGNSEKLSVEFNTDITVSERPDYGYMGWATAAEMVELEGYNFNAMLNSSDRTAYNGLLSYYRNGRFSAISPATQLYLRHNLGEISSDQLSKELSSLSTRNYRREWSDAAETTQVLQQYNLGIRVKGKSLSSDIVFNYKHDNNGMQRERNSALTFSYRGDLKVTSWWNIIVGAQVISERAKLSGDDTEWSSVTSYMAYESMRGADGSLSRMQGNMPLDSEYLGVAAYGLKDTGYNYLEERLRSSLRQRRTNIRT